MKIAFFSSKTYDETSFSKVNTHHKFTFLSNQLNEQTAILATGCEAVCAFVNDQLNDKTLVILNKLGISCILLRCAGFNNVDLKTAEALNIKVFRVPAYSPNAVAEHAVALILTLNRKIHKAYNRVRESNFSLVQLEGFDLVNKTVGVIGTGNIGIAFCKIMLGFGCKVIAYDIEKNPLLAESDVEYVDLQELYKRSDIISLHCPLNEKTKHIINSKSINEMKSNVMVINTSRGALLDTKAAIQALKSNTIGYLGIDVYEQEEHIFFKDLSGTIITDDDITRLTTFPNVIITAHQGFFTYEALQQITETTLNNATHYENKTATSSEVKL